MKERFSNEYLKLEWKVGQQRRAEQRRQEADQ